MVILESSDKVDIMECDICMFTDYFLILDGQQADSRREKCILGTTLSRDVTELAMRRRAAMRGNVAICC